MEKTIKIGINGFGRIGRSLTRVIQQNPQLKLVAINDLAPVETLAHLLKYDSVHGHFSSPVSTENGELIIDGQRVQFTQFKTPNDIPWQNSAVDIVIESSGHFRTKQDCKAHLKPGVKKVIISAPARDAETTAVVLGVNDKKVDLSETIISNASCTTNCAAPMVKLIDENFGIESAYVTTVHSFTSDQRLHDAPHPDLRRARAATLSMVPTTTGAAKALSVVFPHLNGKIGGCGIRVPVPDGSLTDITFHVKKDTTAEEVNELFKNAAENGLKGILAYTEEPLVSIDIVGNPHSCIFDAQLTSVLGKMVKIVGWYDNEMGYSNRLADLILRIAKN